MKSATNLYMCVLTCTSFPKIVGSPIKAPSSSYSLNFAFLFIFVYFPNIFLPSEHKKVSIYFESTWNSQASSMIISSLENYSRMNDSDITLQTSVKNSINLSFSTFSFAFNFKSTRWFRMWSIIKIRNHLKFIYRLSRNSEIKRKWL